MRAWVASVALVALVGCQTTADEPAQSAMQPMEKPPGLQLGDAVIWLVNGKKEQRNEVTDRDDRQVTIAEDTGCVFSLPTSGYAPAYSFTNCNGFTGTQNVEAPSESPFPLTVGKSWTYAYSGSNTKGGEWNDTRRCKVEATARITVPLGEFDTYKVVCNDEFHRRTWYVSPEQGMSVKFISHYKPQNSTRTIEMVRLEKAPGS